MSMTIDGGTLDAYTDHLILCGHTTRTIDGYLRYLRRFDCEVGALCTDRRKVAHWMANRTWSNATRKSARTAIRAWYRWGCPRAAARRRPDRQPAEHQGAQDAAQAGA